MNKHQFLGELESELIKSLSETEAKEALGYYEELFLEAEEHGRTESEVMRGLPSAAQIAAQIVRDVKGGNPEIVTVKKDEPSLGQKLKEDFTNIGKHVKEYAVSLTKKVKAEQNIVLLVLRIIGIFFFCVVAVPVIFALLTALCAVFVAFWAAAVSILVSGAAAIGFSVYFVISTGAWQSAVAFMGAGFVLMGLGFFFIKGMAASSKAFGKSFTGSAKLISAVFLGGKKNEKERA